MFLDQITQNNKQIQTTQNLDFYVKLFNFEMLENINDKSTKRGEAHEPIPN